MIYDCFVLNEKRNAIFCQGSQAILGMLDARTFASDVGKTSIMVNGELPSGHSYKYKLGTAPETVAYDDVLTTGWTALTTNPLEVTPGSTDTVVTVAEANTSDNKAKAVGSAIVNLG